MVAEASHVLAPLVDDLDAHITQIAERGLEPTRREMQTDGVRRIAFRDPKENEIGFGGVPRRSELAMAPKPGVVRSGSRT